jgi:2-iminobutanoate/2-iminopropanoate deaminase
VNARRINVEGVARLSAFSHAVVAGDHVYVSGMLGAREGEPRLVPGGIGAETTQALRNIERVLAACGATLEDVVKVNVYITDMDRFDEMNAAYVEMFGDDPPARITVGCSGLALGALVEMDCIAVLR